MTVNITFFIQIIHFLIAAWVLRRFLWGPINRVIERVQRADDTVSAGIARQQEIARVKEVKLDGIWQRARKRFAKTTPTLQMSRVLLDPVKISSTDIAETEKKQMVEQLTHTIVERVMHDA